MTQVSDTDKDQFFSDVATASAKAVWAAVATQADDGPRVRMVHPTWDGDVLWFATFKDSPKAVQLRTNPRLDIQWQVSEPEFVHIMARGSAEVLDDPASRRRAWEVLDYDLAQFWPDGVDSPDYVAVKITPERVELSEMFGTTNKRVWRS